MLVKNCAGALVFWDEKVFLLKSERGEWVFPKTAIRMDELPGEAALRAVGENAGIAAEIISTAGHASFEISSETHHKPIYNKIIWYVMISQDQEYLINEEKGFTDGGYFSTKEAMGLLTHNHNKAMLNLLSRHILENASEYASENNLENASKHISQHVSEYIPEPAMV
ncbi:MAG TPA: NUDIX domain-containing protein [Clostridiales bacterium]|nr:NUDIX domain-containing protein [Clostridiales bacterium]